MIQLANVTKQALGEAGEMAFLLSNASIDLPADHFIEFKCPPETRRELLFDLVSGTISPEKGHVMRNGLRVSPLLNRGGNASLLFNGFTLRENIAFQANISFVKARMIEDFVVSVCDCAPQMGQPLAKLAPRLRRAAEVAIFTVIPYDCYLIDKFNVLPDLVQMQVAYAAKRRGAGLFFGSEKNGNKIDFRDAYLHLSEGALELAYPEMEPAAGEPASSARL